MTPRRRQDPLPADVEARIVARLREYASREELRRIYHVSGIRLAELAAQHQIPPKPLDATPDGTARRERHRRKTAEALNREVRRRLNRL